MTFEEYVLSRGPALVRLARLLTGDDQLADDLVQEVLAKAYVRWSRIARAEHPDRYMRRMLVNARNSWWRRAVNREVAVPAVRDVAVSDADPGDRDALWTLVRALPERQRAVLVLRFSVRTHAMRGLAALRAKVGDAGFPVTVRSTP